MSDDTDVFVVLVYWADREEMTSKVQMERWNGTVLDINATCADLGTTMPATACLACMPSADVT